MAESIAYESIMPEGGEAPESAPVLDTHAGSVATRMLLAFLATFAKAAGIIVPAESTFRVTYGPGDTSRVTLKAHESAHVSDARAWFHVAAGRSSSARRIGYTRACIVQAALTLAAGDAKSASLAMQAHGAEKPEGRKPEQWARALEGATGAIGDAFAALVSAQGDYAFPFASKPVKSGKLAHRWYAFYENDGKTAKVAIPSSWVPDPTAYDPDADGDGTTVDRTDDAEIPSKLVLFGIEHDVIVKRVEVRK